MFGGRLFFLWENRFEKKICSPNSVSKSPRISEKEPEIAQLLAELFGTVESRRRIFRNIWTPAVLSHPR